MKTKMHVLLGLSSCALMLATAQAQGFAMNSATPMPVIQEPQAPPAQNVARPDHAEPGPNQGEHVHRNHRQGRRKLRPS